MPQTGHDSEKAETLEALDFVARPLAHVPDPRRHLVRYDGAYSNVVRSKLKASVQAQQSAPLGPGPGEVNSRFLSLGRAGREQTIRCVFEIGPHLQFSSNEVILDEGKMGTAYQEFVSELQNDAGLQNELKAGFGDPAAGIAGKGLAAFAASKGHKFKVEELGGELSDYQLNAVSGGALFVKKF